MAKAIGRKSVQCLIVGAIFIVTPGWTIADNDWRSACKSFSGLAESVMELRQAGAPVHKVMEGVAEDPMIETMVMAAYEVPLYSTHQKKVDAAAEFRNQSYLECAKIWRPSDKD